MVAHNVRHTVMCPSYGNGLLSQCTCGAVGSWERDVRSTKKHENAEANAERVREVIRETWINVMRACGYSAAAISTNAAHQNATVARCDKESLDYVGGAVSALALRLVSVTRPTGWDCTTELRLVVHQLCPACRESHETVISQGEVADPLKLVGMVGAESRRARLRHRCHPITAHPAALSHLTHDDLTEIAAELERDGTEMVKRSQEFAKLADERAARAAIAAIERKADDRDDT